jgi:outer membrane protein OmpA-like peptidoglycan-associated protein
LAGDATVTASTTPGRQSILLEPKTTTSRPSPTTSAVSTPSRPSPRTTTAPHVTHGALPLHGAVYRQGKLYLSGALPSRKVADAFVKKASDVIGASNVVETYIIDRRAPVPTEGRVRVDEPFLFRTGSAELDPQYDSLLNLGVTVMRLNPQVTMKVVGYTDDTGPLPFNLVLSRARAQAVADWISARGISARRFIVIGKGPADPLASNATPAGRTLNRRIEVELLGLLNR